MYFPCESREVTVEGFINVKKGNMSVDEYTLKFTMLYRYVPSIVSNPSDEMNTFFTSVADLVKEMCHTTMIHGYMN